MIFFTTHKAFSFFAQFKRKDEKSRRSRRERVQFNKAIIGKMQIIEIGL